jgi:tetraacyldisaccharide 4'-kinase
MRAAVIAAMRGDKRGLGGCLLRGGLGALMPFYGAAVAGRNAAFDLGLRRPRRLGRPVISVGNLTTGGTGKTPMVIELARRLVALGARPAVLLRGYKATAAGSDEAALLADALGPAVPVAADPRRDRAAKAVLAANPQVSVFLLDDGFQHRQVWRDLDLVLVDATYPLGRAHLLPRGFLREPVGNLRRASAVIVTHADVVTPPEVAEIDRLITRVHGRAPLAHAAHRWTGFRDSAGADQPSDALRGRKVLAVCGIGNPAAFGSMVAAAAGGYELVAMSDHHAYTAADLSGLAARARQSNCGAVVTTEKDWIKWAILPGGAGALLGGLPVYRPALTIELVDGSEALTQLLRAVLPARRSDDRVS